MMDLKNKKVLIVEDSRTQALLLKETLERNLLSVSIAKDGREGLQHLNQSIPDLIISDIEMPSMNGYDFCKKVKSDDKLKNVPVILLTNLSDPLDVIKGMDCGADGFLTKPCESDLLFSTIENTFKNIGLIKNYSNQKVSFFFRNESQTININPVQIIELLLSTYSSAIQKNSELEKTNQKLNALYQELEEKNKNLKELNEQKNQLLGMAAHDLRNPLSVISGYSNFLLQMSKDDFNKEKSHEMIERINNTSSFMISVINDFLDFSTIESGTLTLHFAEIDLPKLIEKDLLFFDSLAEKKELKLIFNYKKPIPTIWCDPNKISQVLNNLITNAIKFSHPKSSVEISLLPSENDITIIVKDYGIGMSSEDCDKLFQPFTKLKKTGTAGEKGTGLGLAIVHKIIQEHHGKIWAESTLGKGSTFYVSLPKKNLS